jgi:hypothetical protein
MNRIILGFCSILASMPLLATNQFDQLHALEQQHQREVAAAAAEQARQAAAEQARLAEQRRVEQRQQQEAQRLADNRASALRKEKQAEEQRLRNRNEKYEDQLRAMELESRQLELQARRAVTERTDDYIDADLNEQAARTDVLQSGADATRNLALGNKALLEDTGKAEVNRSSRIFGD